MKGDEGLADLIRYAGGFLPTAAPEIIHIRRILPFADAGARSAGSRLPGCSHRPGRPCPDRRGQLVPLLDGDTIS